MTQSVKNSKGNISENQIKEAQVTALCSLHGSNEEFPVAN